jgi:hypothetical protein
MDNDGLDVGATVDRIMAALAEVPAEQHLAAAEVLVNIGIALMKGLAPLEQVQGYLEAATKDCQEPKQVVARFSPRH